MILNISFTLINDWGGILIYLTYICTRFQKGISHHHTTVKNGIEEANITNLYEINKFDNFQQLKPDL